MIENEFGEENIDNDILVTETQEQIIQMSNGCICCTIREDLRETLADWPTPVQGELNSSAWVIETTGLADPGPVAQTLHGRRGGRGLPARLRSRRWWTQKHGEQQLDSRQEAGRSFPPIRSS